MLEIELKLVLKARESTKLAAALGAPDSERDQLNEYFDALDESWRRAGLAVRLREESGRGVLSVKGSAQSRQGWTERLELQAPIDAAELRRLRIEPGSLDRRIRTLFGDQLPSGLSPLALAPIGRLRNHRRAYRRAGGEAELALDRSHFPDGSTQYELELEASTREIAREEEGALRQLFAQQKIAWRPGTISKYARLLRMLG